MTALAAPRRARSVPLGARLVAAAVVAGVVAVLFLTGILPAHKWQPFLVPTTWRFLGEGLLLTLAMGSVALVSSVALGLPLGLARTSLPGPARWLVAAWVEAVRATPILAIILIVYLGLPRVGLDLPAFWAAVLGLVLYNSAVIGEIVRAGVSSIPRGEVDAARSLGLSWWRSMRHVVLPQALARMTPALVGQLITLIKDTSLAFIIGAPELMAQTRPFFTYYGNPLETYIVVACIFFAVCYTLSRLSRRLEARQPAAERVVVLGEEDQLGVA